MFRKVIYVNKPVLMQDKVRWDIQVTCIRYYIFGVRVWISIIENKREY